jgi:hypothetical protein
LTGRAEQGYNTQEPHQIPPAPDNECAVPLIPMVIEQSSRGERAYDIYSRL